MNLINCLQGDKLAKVIKASGNEVEAYWPTLFAKALKGQEIEKLLSNIGSAPVAVAAPAGGAPVAAAAPAGGAAAAKKEEKPKEEEADVDMGGLFGDDY